MAELKTYRVFFKDGNYIDVQAASIEFGLKEDLYLEAGEIRAIVAHERLTEKAHARTTTPVRTGPPA